MCSAPAISYFQPAEVFATRTEVDLELLEIGREGHHVIVVDDFYERPSAVRELLLRTPAPIWKHQAGGHNFVDYYDCRHRWRNIDGPWVPAIRAIVAAGFDQPAIESVDVDLISNIFLLLGEQQGQPHPHNDNAFADLQGFTAVVSLNTDEEAAGGTAFYRYRALDLECAPLGERFEPTLAQVCRPPNVEDGRSYFHAQIEAHWERVHLVPMRFNRLLVFPSHLWHAAWHPPGAFRDYPRVNQAIFVNAERAKREQR